MPRGGDDLQASCDKMTLFVPSGKSQTTPETRRRLSRSGFRSSSRMSTLDASAPSPPTAARPSRSANRHHRVHLVARLRPLGPRTSAGGRVRRAPGRRDLLPGNERIHPHMVPCVFTTHADEHFILDHHLALGDPFIAARLSGRVMADSCLAEEGERGAERLGAVERRLLPFDARTSVPLQFRRLQHKHHGRSTSRKIHAPRDPRVPLIPDYLKDRDGPFDAAGTGQRQFPRLRGDGESWASEVPRC